MLPRGAGFGTYILVAPSRFNDTLPSTLLCAVANTDSQHIGQQLRIVCSAKPLHFALCTEANGFNKALPIPSIFVRIPYQRLAGDPHAAQHRLASCAEGPDRLWQCQITRQTADERRAERLGVDRTLLPCNARMRSQILAVLLVLHGAHPLVDVFVGTKHQSCVVIR